MFPGGRWCGTLDSVRGHRVNIMVYSSGGRQDNSIVPLCDRIQGTNTAHIQLWKQKVFIATTGTTEKLVSMSVFDTRVSAV